MRAKSFERKTDINLIATAEKERAVLIGVTTRSLSDTLRESELNADYGLATDRSRRANALRSRVEDYLEELELLAESAGAEVVGTLIQERQSIDPAYFIGSGKARELGDFVEKERINLVVFDDDLSAVQVRNLERIIKCKIVDRSGIILDIFASRARTREAKTQVELAQLQYMLPRLTRQWTHLSKQFGGIGTKGPGETQIETDRRAIRTRISHLREKIKHIAKERKEQRKGRDKLPRVALVGYTNAGKSTLLNWFSNADVLVEDKLFATLDSTVRAVSLSPAHKILLSDTVGFIRKLPHNLVASFKSTLEEVVESDILLHVVDISHPLFEDQIEVVNDTLEELQAANKPTIIVFNKIDRLEDRSIVSLLGKQYPNAVFISASRSINLGSLQTKIMELLDANIAEQTMTFSQHDHRIISQIHDMAEILEKTYEGDGITIRFRMNNIHADKLKKALAKRNLN
ncbi:MAG: GTPase HflX [Bacteroidetes bacterium]|nr:GTPase HflX [Bacteroidota bacterium]MCW5893971.1 GTPase HflX [Bacteroidota bacterium]